MEAAPPSYTTADPPSNTHEAPPAYSVPDGFAIGSRTAKPFVDASQIKDHLLLLYAFAELKISVEGMSATGIPHLPSDNERRWACFVGLAVERFEKWCKALQPSHSEKGIATILPPVDVLMVWHAYLLNPGWHAEDIIRVEALKGLHQAEDGFAAILGNGLGELLVATPSQARIDNWTQMTATPFDPFESATQTVTREIACPKCRAVVYAPYMTEQGTGYLQQNFTIKCISQECDFEITRDSLGLRKLVNALANSKDGGDKDASGLLAGTIHTPTNVLDINRGKVVKGAMLSSMTLRRPDGSKAGTRISDAAYADFLMERGKYQLDRLRGILSMKMQGHGGKLINRIMSAYVDDKMFSVELVGAVLRQGSFVAKMHDLQWTKPGFFDSAEDEIALQHAMARYHAFLDLMSSSPASFFVPTLDVDLSWHTHQLMADNYSKRTIEFVGRFVDHDDKVEESQLASSFDLTCRAWKNRFGVEYTHCGCPLPGDTIGQRLSRLVGNGKNPSYLIPPKRDDLLAATHPSDHNAVFAFHHKSESESAQRRRRLKIEKRQQRDLKREQEGKLDRRNVQHDPAFLIPVPLYYPSAMVGCAAFSGSVINGGGGFGGCAAVRDFCVGV
ncbi:hypothetical protein DFH08DRAFT_703050 [Mycena albidolilacea]|uniref:Uncharacterized protein n=1 Tax=Mycena albidolilacea TaxID=1033008 RepID=A0AAD7ENX1_9AGAR|nr:hypothetical protein DFH08DRAFT_703050 [Mycena albidolilacea]